MLANIAITCVPELPGEAVAGATGASVAPAAPPDLAPKPGLAPVREWLFPGVAVAAVPAEAAGPAPATGPIDPFAAKPGRVRAAPPVDVPAAARAGSSSPLVG